HTGVRAPQDERLSRLVHMGFRSPVGSAPVAKPLEGAVAMGMVVSDRPARCAADLRRAATHKCRGHHQTDHSAVISLVRESNNITRQPRHGSDVTSPCYGDFFA